MIIGSGSPIRNQAITRYKIDPDQWPHMASIDSSKLNIFSAAHILQDMLYKIIHLYHDLFLYIPPPKFDADVKHGLASISYFSKTHDIHIARLFCWPCGRVKRDAMHEFPYFGFVSRCRLFSAYNIWHKKEMRHKQATKYLSVDFHGKGGNIAYGNVGSKVWLSTSPY